MEKEWQPIATAPAHVELELSIYDKGEYHALAFPSQGDGSGWRDVRANRRLPLEPTHWRLWEPDVTPSGVFDGCDRQDPGGIACQRGVVE